MGFFSLQNKEFDMPATNVTYLSIAQISERLSVAPVTIYRWMKLGQFPAGRHFSPGCRRWSMQEIVDWETSRDTASAA